MRAASRIDELLRKAKDGDVQAELDLGRAYFYGSPRNLDEAKKWFRAAADQGSAEAQEQIGSLYRAGVGFPVDNVEAVKWFRRAA